jgi:hypothetical protein
MVQWTFDRTLGQEHQKGEDPAFFGIEEVSFERRGDRSKHRIRELRMRLIASTGKVFSIL